MPKETIDYDEWAAEILRVGNRAVREAQTRNRALGIPNWYCIGGRLISDVQIVRATDEIPEDE